MTRVDAINAVAAVSAVMLAIAAAMVGGGGARPARVAGGDVEADGVRVVELPGGGRGVVDAGGAVIPVAAYRRVASASSVSDWILAELCGVECAIAYTERAVREAPWRHTLKPVASTIASLDDIEAVLALRPDLLVVDSFGDPRRVARLREHGLRVFDLGQMRGAASAARAMRAVGAVVDRGERGARLAGRYLRDLRGIASGGGEGGSGPGGPGDRAEAMYVSAFGGQLFGGAAGTAYHDVLRYAGLDDVAARRFEGFPEYSAEQLLALDPERIVTREGGGAALCRRAGLGSLRACRAPGGVVELDGFALDDPGLGILESAEALHEAVYGSRAPARERR